MEPAINLSFSEWSVANQLTRHFSKKEGYTVSIPSSRQQRGFDLILYNSFSKKALTIQVKASRTYNKRPKRSTTEYLHNRTWFHSFPIEKGDADFYILFGLYIKSPRNSKDVRISKQKWYDSVLLLFSEKEMIELLSKLTLKTSNKKDTQFGFGFNDAEKVILFRGFREKKDFSGKLFHNRIHTIKRKLNPKSKKLVTKKQNKK